MGCPTTRLQCRLQWCSAVNYSSNGSEIFLHLIRPYFLLARIHGFDHLPLRCRRALWLVKKASTHRWPNILLMRGNALNNFTANRIQFFHDFSAFHPKFQFVLQAQSAMLQPPTYYTELLLGYGRNMLAFALI